MTEMSDEQIITLLRTLKNIELSLSIIAGKFDDGLVVQTTERER